VYKNQFFLSTVPYIKGENVFSIGLLNPSSS